MCQYQITRGKRFNILVLLLVFTVTKKEKQKIRRVVCLIAKVTSKMKKEEKLMAKLENHNLLLLRDKL